MKLKLNKYIKQGKQKEIENNKKTNILPQSI